MKRKLVVIALLFMVVVSLASCKKEEPTIDLSAVNPKNDVYYELFVRSFADSDGDGIGDFNGVTENLDYLQNLGITAIWLMPVNEGPSYHGYSVTDYYAVESDYGTMDDFQNLIDAAHQKGIKIMMDLVINHTSDQNPWYTESRYDTTSPYRDYYLWTSNDQAYSSFVGGMVDLNLKSTAVVEEIHHIIDFYMAMGVTGFRLDAAQHFMIKDINNGSVADNIIFIAQLNAYIKGINEDSFLVSEVYDTSFDMVAPYFQASDSAFNFYASEKMITSLSGSDISFFARRVQNTYEAYSEYNSEFVDTPFLRNHDQDRTASSISGDNLDQKLLLSANVLLTLPGSPIIYYGDEIGLKGTRFDEGLNIAGYDTTIYDEYRRSALLWGNDYTTSWLPEYGFNTGLKTVSEQLDDPNSLLSQYKEMIAIRKAHPALMYGNAFDLYKGNDNKIQGFIRSYQYDTINEAVLVIHNFSSTTYQITDLNYETLIYGSLDMPAYSTLIVTINPDLVGDYI
ncbi:MAG: alpha-amylase family glycosyl hydrolase [Acholeplasmataceae bacterium]